MSAVPAATNGINCVIGTGSAAAIDSTANQTFAMNIAHSVANASTTFVVDEIVMYQVK